MAKIVSMKCLLAKPAPIYKNAETQTSEYLYMNSVRTSRQFKVIGHNEIEVYRVSRNSVHTGRKSIGNRLANAESPLPSPQYTPSQQHMKQSTFANQRKSLSYDALTTLPSTKQSLCYIPI